jgi:dihydrofolate reductase
MWNVMTLDGFFEGPKSWDLNFHDTVWGDELEKISIDQLKAADCLLFGRVTYEGMAAYWSNAEGTAEDSVAKLMNAIPKIVFSRTLAAADWKNTRLVKGSAEDEVAKLRTEKGKDILIFGSANLSASLAHRGLIDEYRICIAPLSIGVGSPLFKAGTPLKLKLLDVKTLKSGGVILRYAPPA